MTSKLTLNAVAAAAALFFAADAGAQVKSDIKADPKSSSCTENCVDAGYEWAIANTPVEDADCAATNADFAEGCAHWLEEAREAAAPPLEEPVATDASGEAEGAPAADSATSTQIDDSSAPPSDAPADDSATPASNH
jgi:hypothetical protein